MRSYSVSAPIIALTPCTRSVLKPKGVFLYLTFGQPHFRRPLLQREAWQIETRTLGEQDMFPYYCECKAAHPRDERSPSSCVLTHLSSLSLHLQETIDAFREMRGLVREKDKLLRAVRSLVPSRWLGGLCAFS